MGVNRNEDWGALGMVPEDAQIAASNADLLKLLGDLNSASVVVLTGGTCVAPLEVGVEPARVARPPWSISMWGRRSWTVGYTDSCRISWSAHRGIRGGGGWPPMLPTGGAGIWRQGPTRVTVCLTCWTPHCHGPRCPQLGDASDWVCTYHTRASERSGQRLHR